MKKSRKKRSAVKRAPAKSPTLPTRPAVYDRAEPNARLSAEKADILKTFDFRHGSITRQRGLGIGLIALGRTAEALAVLDYAHSHVEYRGSANVWYAAGTACSVAGYLRRKQGEGAKAVEDLKRFIDPPFHAIIFQTDVWTADFVRKHLDEERARFASSRDSQKPQFALEARTWWIATLIFFREMALVGYPKKGHVDLTQLDDRIDEALADLAVWLRGEA